MKRIVKVFTSSLIIGSIVFMAMLSTFAYSVDGVELVEVTLTYQDYMDMLAEGGFTVFYRLSSPTSVDISLFDMYQNATSTVVTIGTNPVQYQLTEMSISSGYLVFSSRYAYNMRVNSDASLISELIIDLPFNYYLDNASINLGMYMSGTSTTSVDFSLFLKSDTETILTLSDIRNVNSSFWRERGAIYRWVSDHNISTFPSGYTFDTDSSTGIRTKYSSVNFTSISSDILVDKLIITTDVGSTHTSGTGYSYSFIAPMITYLYLPLTVYVMPDIVDEVIEYLDLIVNPSPADQQRIQDLKDEFEAQSDALHDAAEDIHKDMPTLPNVSGLPQEVTEGVDEATQYVITPLFGVGIVGTVVGTCLVFAVIKLLLYGSGPS